VSRRPLLIVIPILTLLVLGALGIYLYDNSQKNKIAKGVQVAGVDIGGLKPDQARAKLRSELVEPLAQPVVVKYKHKRFTLTPHRSHVAINVDEMVDQALQRSREGSIFTRTYRNLTGGKVKADLEPDISYSKVSVTHLVHRVAKRLNREAQDAKVTFTGDSVGEVKGHKGLSVRTNQLQQAVETAITTPNAAHTLRIPTQHTKPKVSTSELAKKYPTVITIDRGSFRLKLWKALKLQKTYPVAVGQAGLETPAGLYDINDKQVNPSWHVPNSAWAGDLAGQTIPPGPADPIKARWMGIYAGAGIHGTEDTGSLGSAASHGCIRMAIPDVIELYDKVPMGTPVYIA
jgi:lipoprotein-anchoring transpeptidase ErfK/SrfK